MKILERFKIGLKAFMFGGLGRFGNLRIAGRVSNRRYVEQNPIHGYVGWAYAALSMRAKAVGAMKLHLYEMNNKGDVEEVFDHEILSILNKANPVQSQYQFFFTLELFLGIWGSAPIYLERQGRNIISMWPMRPDCLKARTTNQGTITGYTYTVGGLSFEPNVEDVITINEPNPENILTGFSPIGATALEIDTDTDAAVWNRSLLQNAGETSIVLKTDKNLSDEQYTRLQTSWASRQTGPMNAGKAAVLENGLEPVQIGKGPKDMALDETRRFNRGAIVTILGVPEPLITSENSNLANVEGAERIFAKYTVDPQMKLVQDCLNEFFVAQFSENLYIGYDSPIPEDKTYKLSLATQGEGKWLTVNETREMFGYPPLEGGDAIFKPLGVYPQVEGEKSFERIELKRKGGYEEAKMRDIKQYIMSRTFTRRKFMQSLNIRLGERLAKMAADSRKKTVVLKVSKKKILKSEEGENLDPRLKNERIEFLKRLPRKQLTFRKQLQGFFKDLKKEVMKNLEEEGLPKSMKQNREPWIKKVLFAKAAADQVLLQISGEMYRENIEEGSADIARLLGIDGTDILNSPFVLQFIAERENKIRGVNQTTFDALRDSLIEGVEAGEGMGEIRDRVTSIFSQATGFRAETIARTEVASAQNYGRLTEMEQQKVQRKMWISVFNNSRDDHMEADGQVVNVDEPFDVGGERLMHPGDPSGSAAQTINCQCSASPTLDDLT